MRLQDLQIFSNPLEPTERADARSAENALLRRAEVHLPEVDDLSALIHGDLSEASSGVTWWSEQLDAQRRVLISDHLVSAVDSIHTNLLEAALHRFEVDDAWQEVDRKHARMVKPDSTVQVPRPESPADLLAEKLTKLHTAGFFRALGSTLDCVAAAVIGVAAVPQNLLTADFGRVQRWLSGDLNPSVPRHDLHKALQVYLAATIDTAGPHGWLEWMDDYRNMFVHRGRRTELVKVDVEARVLDATGTPVPRAKSTRVLLRNPSVSEVQGFVQLRTRNLTLTEPAETTMALVLQSTMYVAREVSRKLCELWRQRRQSANLVLQPATQWPSPDGSEVTFGGYAPGTVDIKATQMIANPSVSQRIGAAGLRAGDDRVWGPSRKK